MLRGAFILAVGLSIGYAKAKHEDNALTDMVADMKKTANELGEAIKSAETTKTQEGEVVT